MRRKDRKITDFDQILSIFEKADCCRIAINDEFPYIVPLNYGYSVDGEIITLYFHSASEGRKLELLAKNPKIGFELDMGHELTYDDEKGSCSMLYESVIGEGIVEFIDGEEKVAALRTILKKYGRPDDFLIVPGLLERTRVFKVVCKKLSAKKH